MRRRSCMPKNMLKPTKKISGVGFCIGIERADKILGDFHQKRTGQFVCGDAEQASRLGMSAMYPLSASL